jgi:hypothetical protein
MAAHSTDRSRRDFCYLAGARGRHHFRAKSGKVVEAQSPHTGILLATTFTTGTLEERLDAAKAHGLACVQMSMVCAGLPEMPIRFLRNYLTGCAAKRRLVGS